MSGSDCASEFTRMAKLRQAAQARVFQVRRVRAIMDEGNSMNSGAEPSRLPSQPHRAHDLMPGFGDGEIWRSVLQRGLLVAGVAILIAHVQNQVFGNGQAESQAQVFGMMDPYRFLIEVVLHLPGQARA